MIKAPCKMDAIREIDQRHSLKLVEDACQAVGVDDRGRKCGSIGDLDAYSFNHDKTMTIGEGGAVITDDPVLFSRLMNVHDLGIWSRDGYDADNNPPCLASQARISEVQGAMLGVQLSRLAATIEGLKRNRKVIAEVLSDAGGIRISPHNDPDHAAILTVIVASEAQAVAFSTRSGVRRIDDNSKHILTSWHPINHKRSAHPAMNPWAWAKRPISYDEHTCARTLDILRRSCRITISPAWPAHLAWMFAKSLWTPNAAEGAADRLIANLTAGGR